MDEYYEFLMFELQDVIEAKDNDDERVQEIMVTLAAADGSIPETFYRLYVDHLPVDKTKLANGLAYFSGIGEIKVDCDCEPIDKSICDIHEISKNDFFSFGAESVGHTHQWYNARMRVRELYADLWS